MVCRGHRGTRKSETPRPPENVQTEQWDESNGEEETDGSGPSSVRFVDYVPADQYVRLKASPRSGLSPLAVQFTLDLVLTGDIIRFDIDYDGDGSFDLSSPSVPEQLSFTYTSPGLRLVTARLTMADGSAITSTTAVVAQSFATMNALLKTVWRGFVDALAARDIEGALHFFGGSPSGEKYRAPMTTIRDTLPEFARGLRTLDPIWIRDGAAHYLLRRPEEGRVRGYHIYFARNENGLWKIVQF